MATTKNATYKIFNGTDWDTYYFQTSAGQVGESDSRKFINPSTHTINGKKLFDANGDAQGVTLYLGSMQFEANSPTFSGIWSALEEKVDKTKDTNLASTTTNGYMSSTDKSNLDTMWKLWQADDPENTIVDKVQEILKVFETYTEGDNLATTLSKKANTDTTNTFSKTQFFSDVQAGLVTTRRLELTGAFVTDRIEDPDMISMLYTRNGQWYTGSVNMGDFTDEGIVPYKILVKEDLTNHRQIIIKTGTTTPTGTFSSGDIWIN